MFVRASDSKSKCEEIAELLHGASNLHSLVKILQKGAYAIFVEKFVIFDHFVTSFMDIFDPNHRRLNDKSSKKVLLSNSSLPVKTMYGE